MQERSRKRHFDNFLAAYHEYAMDSFCPDSFHLWTGISIIAGALERKVWLPWKKTHNFYPNLYILMIANPGVGKSSACNIGIDMLRQIDQIKFVPTQITVAKLIEDMSEGSAFEIGTQILPHSSGFYYASEASNSLKDVYESIIPCFTDFYDCPAIWERATKKDGVIKIVNLCFNLLAASTFNFLTKLINEDSIMGGFASRLIYVIHDEKMVREAIWGNAENERDREQGQKLFEDLQKISTLVGQFRADDEFKTLWHEWFPKFDKQRQDMPSEKMQSLMARKNTNLFKLCMICSASRGDSLMLTKEDWYEAMAYLDTVEKALPRLLRSSQATQKTTGEGHIQAILEILANTETKKLSQNKLRQLLAVKGFDPSKFPQIMASLMDAGGIVDLCMIGKEQGIELVGNPDDYL